MGYTVKEEHASNSGDGQECTVTWLVQWDGQGNDPAFVDAYNEAWLVTDGTFNGLPRQDISLVEITEISTGSYKRGHWRAEVLYSHRQGDTAAKSTGTEPTAASPTDQNLKDTFNFEVLLEDRIERYPQQGHARWTWDKNQSVAGTNFEKLKPEGLGWEGQEKGFAGLSIPRPKSTFSYDRYVQNSLVNAAFIRNVSRTVGTINHVAWNSWDAGEVLCTGVRGQSDGTERWHLNYTFHAAKNRGSTAQKVYGAENTPFIDFIGAWAIVETEYFKSVKSLPGGKERTQDIVAQINIWYPFERRLFADNLFPQTTPTDILAAWEVGYTFPDPQQAPEFTAAGVTQPIWPGQAGYEG